MRQPNESQCRLRIPAEAISLLQSELGTRDEAVAQALAFAKRQRVRAWFAKGTDEFVLLGTFRKDDAEPARSPCRNRTSPTA